MANERVAAQKGLSQVGPRYKHALTAFLAVACHIDCCFGAEGEARTSFLSTLSKAVLGTTEPRLEANGRVARFILLAEPGITLPQVVGVNEEAKTTLDYVVDKRAVISAYDSVLSARAGVAVVDDGRDLYQVWRDVLTGCKPTGRLIQRKTRARIAAETVLYRQADYIDKIRKISYLDEPTDQYKKYLEYRDLYSILEAQTNADFAWRLMQTFDRFKTLKDAKAGILAEWIRFGFKEQMENALQTIHDDPDSIRWHDWASALAAWEAHATPVTISESFGRTYLYPQPELWASMAAWRFLRAPEDGPLKGFSFQWARVKIYRPWMRFDDLVSGKIDYHSADPPLSTGTLEYPHSFPRGTLPMIASELILVRNIRIPASASVGSDAFDPLTQFAFPDAVNLLGYIVDALLPRP